MSCIVIFTSLTPQAFSATPVISGLRFFVGTTTDGEVTEGGTASAPVEDSTTSMIVAGTASDPDGCGDVYTDVAANIPNIYNVVVYRSGVSGAENCADDVVNCYVFNESYGIFSSVGVSTNDSCDPNDPSDMSVGFYFTDALSSYADATDVSSYEYSNLTWSARVFVEDVSSGSNNTSSAISFEVPTQNAIVISGTAAYSAVTRGIATTSDVILQVYNSANNNRLSYATSATDWACTTGGFTNGSGKGISYSSSANTEYASMTALSTNSGVRIPKKAASNSAFSTYSHTIFTRLKVALTEFAGGNCSTTITYTVT